MSDFTNALMTASIPVILIVGGMATQALRKLAAKWGLEATAQNSANMESDLRAALNVGITQVLPVIQAKGWHSAEAQNTILNLAVAYLKSRFPGRAKQITTQAVAISEVGRDAALKQTLAARLPDAITVAAASPGTPSTTQGTQP